MSFLGFYFIHIIFIAGVYSCGTSSNQENKPVHTSKSMIQIEKKKIGQEDGKDIFLYSISQDRMIVRITNYGGIVTSLMVPDKNGQLADVVLGFDSLENYMAVHPYFGCLVGRYANRIAKGRFTISGQSYALATNNGQNHLHGGLKGFDKKVWDSKEFSENDEAGVELTCLSPDGEEGYPGNMVVSVRYAVTLANELRITYSAETDRPTPCNLTHHGYFNLSGEGSGDILGHELQINAQRYTVVNEELIPTGELRNVSGTPMDFRKAKAIGEEIGSVDGGYDHNFVLDTLDGLKKAAVLTDPVSGRYMEVYTDQPGIQFYSGNFLDGTLIGKSGKKYLNHYGLCLETQHFPDSPNQPGFPNTILIPGEKFSTKTIYKFGTVK